MGTGTLTLSGTQNNLAYVNINGGTLADGIAGTTTLFNTGNLFTFATSGSPTFDLNGNNAVTGLLTGGATGQGLVTNNGATPSDLSVAGTSSRIYNGTIADGTSTVAVDILYTQLLNQGQVFTNPNTYTGGTTINAGGELRLTGAGTVGSGPVVLNSPSTSGANGTYFTLYQTGDLTIGSLSGTLGYASNVETITTVAGHNLTINQTTAGIYPGTITGGGSVTLGSTSTQALTFSGASANTYTGLTTVTAGELDLNKTAGVNAITGLGLLNIASPDVLVNGGTLKWLANEQLANNATISLTSGAVNLNGMTETLGDFSNSGGTFTTGSGKLIGTGASVTWSGGTNTINSGGTVEDAHVAITGGTNEVQGGGLLQVDDGGLGLQLTGSTLTLDSASGTAGELLLGKTASTSANLTTFASSTTSNISSGGSATNAGYIDLNGGTSTFTIASGTTPSGVDLAISAVIQDGALTKAGPGTLALTGANTYRAARRSARVHSNSAMAAAQDRFRPAARSPITAISPSTAPARWRKAPTSPRRRSVVRVRLPRRVAGDDVIDCQHLPRRHDGQRRYTVCHQRQRLGDR